MPSWPILLPIALPQNAISSAPSTNCKFDFMRFILYLGRLPRVYGVAEVSWLDSICSLEFKAGQGSTAGG